MNRNDDQKPSGSRLMRTTTLGVALLSLGMLVLLVAGMRQVGASEIVRLVDDGSRSTSTVQTLPTTRRDFFLPGTQPHSLQQGFLGSRNCRTCHTEPIYDAWRGSMMSQAARDPLFYAALEVANKDAAEAGEYCLRCHTPGGWLEGRSHPADGSGLTSADLSDGVSCEVCHRMVDPVPGAADETASFDIAIRSTLTSTLPAGHSGSAMLIVDPLDRRRGPFNVTAPHNTWQSSFQGQSTNAITESRLCGSCHNVDNPVLSWTENPPGGGPAQYWPNDLDAAAPSFGKGDLYPLERTYDEWLNSAFPAGGVYAPQFTGVKPDGIAASCQDCHMERQTGTAAIAAFSPVFRDCFTTGCLPAHTLIGGNAWVPQILQDTRWRLNSAGDGDLLDETSLQAESMLRRAAQLHVRLEEDDGNKMATVRIINESGHKLPTGYPEGRRMWLHLQGFDDTGMLVYESGAYDDSTGRLIADAAMKVYEVKPGLTPELAAVIGKSPGATFHFALNNMVVKDNRIPPKGYTIAAFDQPGLRPVDANYVDGQYWDDTEYLLPDEVIKIVASLYYQTASGDYIEFLVKNGGPDAQVLGQLWADSKSPPVLMAQRTDPPVSELFVPLINR